jgi:hypothetical protein
MPLLVVALPLSRCSPCIFPGLFPTSLYPKTNQLIKYITKVDKSSAIAFWTSYFAGAVTKPFQAFLTTPEEDVVLNQTKRRFS